MGKMGSREQMKENDSYALMVFVLVVKLSCIVWLKTPITKHCLHGFSFVKSGRGCRWMCMLRLCDKKGFMF